jgi:hypothetical protein
MFSGRTRIERGDRQVWPGLSLEAHIGDENDPTGKKRREESSASFY